jgi:hypothetical protein
MTPTELRDPSKNHAPVPDETAVSDLAVPATIPPANEAGNGNHADVAQNPPISTDEGHIGRIVAGSLIAVLVIAIGVVAVPFAGAPEHVITGSVLLTFAGAWATLSALSKRWTNQPQRWAIAPVTTPTGPDSFNSRSGPTTRPELTDVGSQWLLQSNGDLNEPWVFVVGVDGKLAARFDSVTSRDELERLLRQFPVIGSAT